ncbi:PREDICTED: putative phospholipase B-like lamina ancestor isoform X2 [Diuraphis noxia]|uniref:putative phospholipase B-like lamina ancestor isoform X2 n=1 Tax=Diuraphis noxia TaxID=143948 RepID=UPI0007636D05|nr:PREDICTED: putative phospholipase B-like lamina ancestor isoform X2 [Diuraphis noxia]
MVLEVETQAEYPDYVQAKAAGYLEGSLTWRMIYWHWKNTVENTCIGRKNFCERIRKYLEENAEEIKRTAKRRGESDPFWHQVDMFYMQLKALEDGWRFGVKRSRQDIDIPSVDFLWMNIMPDLKNFEQKWNASKDFNPDKPPLSATLVKIINTNPIDFVLAQSTSRYYGSMLRIQKRYNFGFHETESVDSALVNGKIVEFSSYPGSIYSQDDFYKITKKGSVSETIVIGTELQNNNRQLWEKIMKTDQVLLGARTMAANRLASNSKKWYEVFSRNNSGTGNKQWLIISTNSTSIAFGVIEQMPGIVSYEELSKTLLSNGYWVSNSSPCLKETFYISSGDERDAADHPVAIILRNGQRNVTDIGTLVDLMRGTEMSLIGRTDLLGVKTNAMFRRFANQSFVEQLTAANRLQSVDMTAPLKDDRTTIVTNRLPSSAVSDDKLNTDKCFTGLVDLKVTSANMNGYYMASGPPFTEDRAEVEPFRWSESPIRHLPHYGHPDVWDFEVEAVVWVWK